MTVKEVLYLAATELGIYDEVRNFIENGLAVGKKETQKLLSYYQLVENELALDYFPLRTEETMYASNGKIVYSRLSKGVSRILYVKNADGERIRFQIFADHLLTDEGTVTIGYAYAPSSKTYKDSSDFSSQVSARLLSYGIAAEYTLAAGRYEEWAIWDQKYKNAIIAAYRAPKTERLESRRWE